MKQTPGERGWLVAGSSMLQRAALEHLLSLPKYPWGISYTKPSFGGGEPTAESQAACRYMLENDRDRRDGGDGGDNCSDGGPRDWAKRGDRFQKAVPGDSGRGPSSPHGSIFKLERCHGGKSGRECFVGYPIPPPFIVLVSLLQEKSKCCFPSSLRGCSFLNDSNAKPLQSGNHTLTPFLSQGTVV